MANLTTNYITGDQLPSSEWNQLEEINSLITSSAQTPSDSDTNQVKKGVANYVGTADFYVDSGVVNAYVLSTTNSFQPPTTYLVGLEVRFRTNNANTGASTINVASLGVKSIKQSDGVTDIVAGTIPVGEDIRLRYNAASDSFVPSGNYGGVFDNIKVNNKINAAINNSTISSGSITYQGFTTYISGEGAVDDNLDTISGGTAGDIILIKTIGSETITVRDNDISGGNIWLIRNSTRQLQFNVDSIILQFNGSVWFEVLTNTDRDFSSSKGINGYTYLPNGLIYQWGIENVASNVTDTVILPIAYPTAHLNVGCTYHTTNISITNTCNATKTSLSQIGVTNGSSLTFDISWYSIGY